MTVTIHCEHCGKRIEAPDSAGGKWGKCPACHNKLYVPDLSEGEELKLAPIDESEEARRKRLIDETSKLSEDILLEKEIPDESAEVEVDATVWPAEISDEQLKKNIIGYLRQMAEGQMEAAKRSKGLITPYGKRTIKILDKIALAEILEPELAGIPQQKLSGLIRELRSKIG
jgi:phage FluMu protein Com